MSFKSIKERICTKIDLYYDVIISKENSYYYKKYGKGQDWEDGVAVYEKFMLDREVEIESLLIELKKKSEGCASFFLDTSLINYINCVNKRIIDFISPVNYLNRLIFFQMEEIFYDDIKSKRFLENSKSEKFNYNIFIENNKDFNENTQQIKTFISKEIEFMEQLPVSEIFADSVVKRINKFQVDISNLEEQAQRFKDDNVDDWVLFEDKADNRRKVYIQNIKNELIELQKSSNIDLYYFFDCSLKAYLGQIDKKKENYFYDNVDADEIDFYKNELQYLLTPYENRKLSSVYEGRSVNYNYFCDTITSFDISNQKKIEYIINGLIELGIETTIEELIAGRDGDQLIKTPIFEKINRPYTREKIDIDLTPGQNYEPSDTKTSITPPKKSDYNTKIFKSRVTEEWFRDTLLEMNAITKANIAYRGLPAVANAIFRNKLCKENIFKTRVYLKDYIGYLNNEFNANIKSDKSLSNGQNFEIDVQTIVKQFITVNPQ